LATRCYTASGINLSRSWHSTILVIAVALPISLRHCFLNKTTLNFAFIGLTPTTRITCC